MATYISSDTFDPGSTITDATLIMEIVGSPSKLVTVHEVSFQVTTLQAITLYVQFYKTNTPAVGGTLYGPPVLKHQSEFPAHTATVRFWQESPLVLPVSIGNVDIGFTNNLGATVSPPTRATYKANIPGTLGINLSGVNECLVAEIVTGTAPIAIVGFGLVIWSED